MLHDFYERALQYVRAAHLFIRAGGTITSAILYPVRRRSSRDPRCQINFRNGTSLSSPSDLPLLNLIDEIWVRQCYGTNEIDFKKDSTIVDLGANVGVFSVLFAAANPEIRAFLSRNVIRNRLNNVEIVPVACSRQKGEGTLYGRGEGVHHSLFNRNIMMGHEFVPLGKTPIWTLQDVFDRFNVKRCDLLKVDCEGAEYDILFGSSTDTLQRIKRISMEYHVGLNEHSIESLEQFLASHGFVVVRSAMDDEGTGMLYATNYVNSCQSASVG
jgi:FkbM family methyltransferase